jgi:polyisoprenoid-binding protein YceI
MKILGLMMLTFLFVNQIVAQEQFEVISSKVTISGTSNLHDWVSNVNGITATGAIDIVNGEVKGVNHFNVKIAVKSIESENGSIMDNKTYAALKYKRCPNIYFELTSATPLANKRLKVIRKFNIAGVKQTIIIYVDYKVLSNGNIEFTGKKSLKMTDYKVDPPTTMFGALTTGDLVTINFNITVAGKNATSEK